MRFGDPLEYGALGKALDALTARRKMVGSLGRLLAALNHHLRTGEAIGKDKVPRVLHVATDDALSFQSRTSLGA